MQKNPGQAIAKSSVCSSGGNTKPNQGFPLAHILPPVTINEREHCVPNLDESPLLDFVRISLSIGKRGIQNGAVFLQFGIGWGAQASLSARPDQTKRAWGLGSILAN